jgi:hypothetical protein
MKECLWGQLIRQGGLYGLTNQTIDFILIPCYIQLTGTDFVYIKPKF